MQALTSIGLACAVFLGAVVLDVIHALYTRAVIAGRARRASMCSVAMYAISCIGFLSVVRISWLFMIPEAIGLFVGSWISVSKSVQ